MSENGNGDAANGPTDVEAKIIRQVEYYFGDINLIRDKFLQLEIKKDDGWVSLETMIKFPRLAALSTDFEVLKTAIKKSTTDLMEVGDENKIRRNPERPLPGDPDALRNQCKERVVYAKGFPTDATLDDIMAFVEKYGKTDHVQLRRTKEKEFKGSIFCTFVTEEDAKKFVAEESMKYGEQELVRFSKEGYFKHKIEARKQAKEEGIKERQEKKIKEEKEEEDSFKARMTLGTILEVKNLPTDLTREILKEKFGAFEQVQWIDFNKGEKEAKIRFTNEGCAKKAWEAAEKAGEGKVIIDEVELEGRVLEGDEEEEHWRDVVRQQKSGGRSRGGGGRGGGRGRGGRGGRGGFRGGRGGYRGGKRRHGEDGNDGPSESKQVKTEGD